MVAEKRIVAGECQSIDCPVLVTERLVLRPPHQDDIPDLARLAANPRIARMLARMPHPYGTEEAEAFVALAQEGNAPGGTWAVTIGETGAFVGCAGLDPSMRGLELGYWIGEPHWGKGYATEAAEALVDLAFRATGIDMLHAACRTVNAASRRVIRKSGFRYAGEDVMDSLAAGSVPVERYVLDRDDWLELRA